MAARWHFTPDPSRVRNPYFPDTIQHRACRLEYELEDLKQKYAKLGTLYEELRFQREELVAIVRELKKENPDLCLKLITKVITK